MRVPSHPTIVTVVAPIRALVQRLGPHVDDVEPLIVRPGQTLDRDDVVAWLVANGYRREPQVEARGECAVRGSIVGGALALVLSGEPVVNGKACSTSPIEFLPPRRTSRRSSTITGAAA